MRPSTKVFLGLLSCGHLLSEVAAAQDVRVWFYHGLKGTTTRSRVYAIDKGDGHQSGSGKSFTFSRDIGTQVCFEVPNAHPVKYNYSLNRSVDSTAPKLPDFASYAGLLKTILAQTGKAESAGPGEKSELVGPHRVAATSAVLPLMRLVDSLGRLAADLDTVGTALLQSDRPEPFLEVKEGKLGGGAGFAYAQSVLASRSQDRYHFSDPALSTNLEALYQAIRREAASDPQLNLLAEGMIAYGRSLLEARKAIVASYVSVNGDIELCGEVAEGKNTFTLTVQRKDSTGKREVGEDLVKVAVLSNYRRPSVTLDPLAFVAFAPSVRQFQIINDTLRGPKENATAFRPGALLSLNLKRLGATQEFGLGVGLGFGLGGGGEVLSEFLGAVVFSYRDAIRVGLGAGISRFPQSVRGATLDQPLPADAGKLDDLVETDYKGALFLLFTLPGIGLPGT